MQGLSFQYAKNRFCNPGKIIDAGIYTKQATTPNDKGEYPTVVRVALKMDTQVKETGTLYSDAMPDEQAALQYIQNIPVSN